MIKYVLQIAKVTETNSKSRKKCDGDEEVGVESRR